MDGFPHSAIQGSQLVCSSPWLIAAYHGLHRLRVPRHPPHTFFRLIRFLSQSKTIKTSYAQSTNESIFARFLKRLLAPERDEIESVLILDAPRSYQVLEHRIPRSLLTSVVKQLA